MASAGAQAYNGGPGAPPEADGISTGALGLVVVADLTEATRQRRTFDADAILSVND